MYIIAQLPPLPFFTVQYSLHAVKTMFGPTWGCKSITTSSGPLNCLPKLHAFLKIKLD